MYKFFCAALPILIITACAAVGADYGVGGYEVDGYTVYVSDDLSAAAGEKDALAGAASDNTYIPEDVYTPKEQPLYKPEPCACSELDEAERALLPERTVEELGEIIVAAGTFWAEWWETKGRFDWEHLVCWKDEIEDTPVHPALCVKVLPTSGFENINDIRNYLLQLYTAAWVDTLLAHVEPPFIEYNDILLMHTVRVCSGNLEWRKSSHTIINQSGCHALVKSTAILSWVEDVCDICGLIMGYSKMTQYFAFINGRISSTSHCPLFGHPLFGPCLAEHEEARRFRPAFSY